MEGGCCTNKGGCNWAFWVAKWLVVIGGLNWGLIAINNEWNVVNMLLRQWPQVERAVYGIVGLAAVWMLVKMVMRCFGGGCCCSKK